jgi:GDPmannose 4,6-dehydratase
MPSAPSSRRAVIVGISGQDGSYLARLLLDKGYEVIGTSRDAQIARFEGLARLGILDRVRLESMSPTDFRSVFEIFAKWAPDEVYNLAGQSSVALSFAQPVDAINSMLNATVTMLEAIRFLKRPIRFYNAGSSECFGEVTDGPAREDTPFRPRSPYAAAKAAAHWMVANYREGYGIYACSGLLFNHESPLRAERFVTRKVTKTATRIARGSGEKLILGNLAVKRDWGWAPDYVDAMWRMLQKDVPADYVIATGTLSTLEEFIAVAFRTVNLEWRDHVTTDASLMRPTDLAGFAGDASKARVELGWGPTIKMPELAAALMTEEMKSA